MYIYIYIYIGTDRIRLYFYLSSFVERYFYLSSFFRGYLYLSSFFGRLLLLLLSYFSGVLVTALPNRCPPPFLDVKQSMKMPLSDAKMLQSLAKMAPRLMLFKANNCGYGN